MRAGELWRSGYVRLLLAIACGALMQLLVTWCVLGPGADPARASPAHAHDPDSHQPPTAEYEQKRRRVENGIHEFWYYFSTEMHKLELMDQDNHAFKQLEIGRILETAEEHVLTLLTDFRAMKAADGFNSWREAEAVELSDLVQRRLFFLQHPPRCDKARKLVCYFLTSYSIDDQLHHIAYCLIVAYATQRTLILKSQQRDFEKLWLDYFEPVSKKCLDANGISHSEWGAKKDTQVLYLPSRHSLYPVPPYLPPAVPADLAPRLERLHGNPPAWWVGQFLKYVMRPRANTSTLLVESAELIGFARPVVGVAIFKIPSQEDELDLFIEKHMSEAEKYFDTLLHSNDTIQRRIYFVTDTLTLIDKVKIMYHDYEVLHNPKYEFLTSEAIINHIYFLSLCDYVVCAFSSLLCRMAYEVTQSLHPDAADRFHSVDDAYTNYETDSQNHEAIYPHYSKHDGELNLRVGDVIKVARNHWNGSSEGEHVGLVKNGLFPSFKTKVNLETADFPTYPQVPLKDVSS